MKSLSRRIVLAFILSSGGAIMGSAGVQAAVDRPDRTWPLASGETIEGEVAEVFGSIAVIKTKRGRAYAPLENMSDEQLQRVLAFLGARKTDTWANSTSAVAKSVAGKLERLEAGKLVPYQPGERPEPDLYLVYFSAAWCGPCRRFTPELVKAYQKYQEAAPGRVELIFVSNDRDRREQAGYVQKAQMPWPVLKFSKLGSAREIERWAGSGIPCLVALTRNGDVLLHSYRGEEYLGPQEVLKGCDQLVYEIVGKAESVRRGRHRLAVLEHLRATGVRSAGPKPYLLSLNPAKYGEISAQFQASLAIDENGQVTNVSFGDEVSRELQGLLRDDMGKWLFLPAVREGHPAAQMVRVPVTLGAQATGS